MTDENKNLEQLNQTELSRFVVDVFRRTMLHYGYWFNEVHHQLGLEEALLTEQDVSAKIFPIVMKRLGKTLGFEVKDGIPAVLTRMTKEKLISLIDAMSVNWLATDGVWFQAVETRQEMNVAKRTNDTCWSRFSPLEASQIKHFLNMPENGGLSSLVTALNFRLYARINVQSIEKLDKDVILRMNSCRVQSDRAFKGLADYPCKSAGVTEYSMFASNIDNRIKTECIGCPPEKHPAEWFCAWRFYLV